MDTTRLEKELELLRDSENESSKRKSSKIQWLLILLIAGGLAYGGNRWWQSLKPAAANSTNAATDVSGRGGRGGRGGGRGGANGRPAVLTVAAQRKNMNVYLRGLGNAVASNTVTVRSRVDGQLVRVAYKEGQFVKQNDLLAEIDKRPFEVQLAQAKGQLARDQALLQSAKTEQERNQLLLNKGLIPKQQYDQQVATVGQYEGSIQADQAAIDNANLQITYSRIVAPISGQIGLRLVDEGNIVRAADPGGIVVITQLQPISVLFSIPEDNLGEVIRKLRAGQQLRVEAWDHDDTKKIADGVLLTADNQIDPTTGTSKLKSVFDNNNNALYPNQFVNVRLLINVLSGAVVVPGATIQRGTQGTFVYVVGENQTVQLKPVTLQITEGNDVALATGITAGEMVVIEGMDKIQDGMRVDVQTSSGQPTDGASSDPQANRGSGGRGDGRGNGRGRGGRGRRSDQGNGQ